MTGVMHYILSLSLGTAILLWVPMALVLGIPRFRQAGSGQATGTKAGVEPTSGADVIAGTEVTAGMNDGDQATAATDAMASTEVAAGTEGMTPTRAKVFPDPGLTRFATTTLVVCALSGWLSLLFPPGMTAGFLAALWLAFAFSIGALGLLRLAYYGFVRADEVMIAMAMIFLPVGGIWFAASRFGMDLLGFEEPMVALTAEHFHFTGLATTLSIGLLGRLIKVRERMLRLAYRFICAGTILSIPLVAIGINGHPLIEKIGVSSLSLSLFALSFVLLRLAGGRELTESSTRVAGDQDPVALVIPATDTVEAGGVGTSASAIVLQAKSSSLFGARILLCLAAVSILASMTLALIYRFQLAPIDIPLMVFTHGIINAFLFVPSLVGALYMVRPQPAISEVGRPFSRMISFGPVGANFFDSMSGIIDGAKEPPGLIDDLSDFARSDLPVSRIDTDIRRFYEHTNDFELDVEPKWSPVFGFLWTALAKPLFSFCGQMVLPSKDMHINSRMCAIESPMDSRPNVRGWIRVNRATNRPIYVAAYSQHRYRGETFMNIAFPLPYCNITSILRMDFVEPNNLILSSLSRDDFAGDQGVYLVFPAFAARLPIDETIEVFAGEPLRARHEMFMFGIRFLVLEYAMRARS